MSPVIQSGTILNGSGGRSDHRFGFESPCADFHYRVMSVPPEGHALKIDHNYSVWLFSLALCIHIVQSLLIKSYFMILY